MCSIRSEFDLGDRPQRELLLGSLDDAQDQLRRARERLERAERRVRNLELAVQSWKVLVAQYDNATEPHFERPRADIQL